MTRFLAWLRREWDLMRADTWKPSTAFTHEDPRCQHTLAKLRLARAAMKRRGTKLLLEDRPAWQKVVTNEELQPRGLVVVPMRRKG